MYGTSRTPIVYENVAIGMILQRIAECRCTNSLWSPYLYGIYTNQVRPLEKDYSDSIVGIGDKIIILEFKAPTIEKGNAMKYSRIQFNKYVKIAKRIGYENFFLALVHANIPRDALTNKSDLGLLYWYAVPATTLFVPLFNIVSHIERRTGTKIDNLQLSDRGSLKVKRVVDAPEVSLDFYSTAIPECALTRQKECVKYYPHHASTPPCLCNETVCRSCGGMPNSRCFCNKCYTDCISHCLKLGDLAGMLKCLRCWDLCGKIECACAIPSVYASIKYMPNKGDDSNEEEHMILPSLTLAMLLHSLLNCSIGYRINDESDMEKNKEGDSRSNDSDWMVASGCLQ